MCSSVAVQWCSTCAVLFNIVLAVPDNWSREEVDAAVSDYFAMLAQELRGELFNKAEHNRVLQLMLRDRPRGAVERKHQNISAVLIEAGSIH